MLDTDWGRWIVCRLKGSVFQHVSVTMRPVVGTAASVPENILARCVLLLLWYIRCLLLFSAGGDHAAIPFKVMYPTDNIHVSFVHIPSLV